MGGIVSIFVKYFTHLREFYSLHDKKSAPLQRGAFGSEGDLDSLFNSFIRLVSRRTAEPSGLDGQSASF